MSVRQIGHPVSIATSLSMQLEQNRARPHGTSATAHRGYIFMPDKLIRHSQVLHFQVVHFQRPSVIGNVSGASRELERSQY